MNNQSFLNLNTKMIAALEKAIQTKRYISLERVSAFSLENLLKPCAAGESYAEVLEKLCYLFLKTNELYQF